MIGKTIGHYHVVAKLGEGGMGEVYRARDPRIGRDVAIKVLPAAIAADVERLRRFEQEARASGALNHPNVLTLYDVGTSEGRPYLVMELLDGETLRERVIRGAMPPARACELVAEIARGLAAAHAKGIVHRDLKPENVMITRDGRVKILDFGIAKLRDPEPDAGAPTITTPLHTEPHSMLGTAGYMAPEQVRGHDADARADFFAVGTILFELLTGGRAFRRASQVETLHAILHDDPPAPSTIAPTVSPGLDRLVRRCLEKDPAARFQTASDLAFALETAAIGTGSHTVVTAPLAPVRRPMAARLAIGAAIVAALAATVIWSMRPERPSAGRALARFAIQPPPGTQFAGMPVLSPDGSMLVFAAAGGGSGRIYLRRLDQLERTALPGTENGFQPFVSPDGKVIGFTSGGKLKTVTVDGAAPPITVCDVGISLGGAWLPDGTIVFGSIRHPLQRVPAAGGVPQPIGALDAGRAEIDHHNPRVLPGGKAIVFAVHEGQKRFRIAGLVLATGEQRTLIESGFDPQYLPTGHLLFARADGLYAVRFDPDRLSVSGEPAKLFAGVATDAHNGGGYFAASATGTLVFEPQRPMARRTLAWMDRAGVSTPLAIEPRSYSTPRIAPDGRRIALAVSEQERQHIWVYDAEAGTAAPVTFEGFNKTPLWTRDGVRLTYTSERADAQHVMWQPADASAPAESLISGSNDLIPASWTADGRSLVYMDDPPTNDSELRVLTVNGRGSRPLEPNVPLRSNWPALSPDGRWLAFVIMSEGGVRPDIYVQPFPGPGIRRRIVEAASQPVWSRDGRELFFRTRRGAPPSTLGLPVGDGIFVLPFDAASGIASARETQLFRARMTDDAWGVPSFDVSPDGRRFLVVIADNEEFTPVELTVVMHVDDELRRRVP